MRDFIIVMTMSHLHPHPRYHDEQHRYYNESGKRESDGYDRIDSFHPASA